MITKKRWAQEVMIAGFLKEATYNAGVTMNASNAFSLKGHSTEVSWPDVVVNDKDEVTGTEHGTDQELVEPRVEVTIGEPKAKPNSLAMACAYTLGSTVSTQDATNPAYKHKSTPVAVGTALPSTQLEEKDGGVQYANKGIKFNTLKITGNRGDGFVSWEAGLMGSGNRAISATAFVAAITESWLKMRGCKVWMESGADISIAAALTHGTEDISSATPADLAVRLRNFELNWNNNLIGQEGNDGTGEYADLDYGKRSMELTFQLLFNDVTELNHFINQDPLAVEFDLKGAAIPSSTLFFGTQLIVPRFKLREAPRPKDDGGILVCDMVCDVQDDGTNAPLITETNTAQAAYAA